MPGYAAVPEDGAGDSDRRQAGSDWRHVERGWQVLRVLGRGQTLPVRRRNARQQRSGCCGCSGGAGTRRWPWRAGRAGTRPAVRHCQLAGQQAEGVLSRSQPLGQRRRRRRAKSPSRPTAARRSASSTARRAGCTAKSSARRTAMWWSPDGKKLALLPLRREQGAGLLPADGPDADPEHARRRGVSEGRRAEPDRRPVRVRRGDQEDAPGRRARRQAVRQRRRRPLRLPRRAGRPTARELSSIAPTAARTSWSSRRADSGDRRVPRGRARGVADRAGSRTGRAMRS